MIGGRQAGVRLVATFDDFMVIPPKAWEQCKAAIVATLALYGLRGFVEDAGGQPEAYERWCEWMKDNGD